MVILFNSKKLPLPKREKFSKDPGFILKAETLMAEIERKAILFSPKTTVNLIADAPGNRLLKLAEESEADFLVTGNTNGFTISNYKKQVYYLLKLTTRNIIRFNISALA